MTLTIPTAVENEVKTRAEMLKISPDEYVEQALKWYLGIDADLLEEMAAWEATGLESLAMVEESLG